MLRIDPSAAPLPPLRVGTAPLRAGETIRVLGYPGVGGVTLTVTQGVYSGTTQYQGATWIKTDADIHGGNSGGPALDAQGSVIGVATATLTLERDSFNYLVPAVDVNRLIEGTLGDESSGSGGSATHVGDGEWIRDFTTNGRDAYVALYAEAGDHTMRGIYADVEPGLFVFCGDDVQVDFWSPVIESWGWGPYIAGQIDYRNIERNGRVPVGYRIGGEHSDFHFDLWWPTSNNKGLISGERGADFVTALLAGSGSLGLAWTNWDDSTEAILFPSMDGFSSVYEHLERHCD